MIKYTIENDFCRYLFVLFSYINYRDLNIVYLSVVTVVIGRLEVSKTTCNYQ